MINPAKLCALACALLLLAASGCQREKRGPIEVTAAEGANVVKAVAGSEGGSLRFASDGARLVVGPNLLQEDVTIVMKRVKPSFDLSGKDFVGKAYRISPRLTFAPGAARLYVPVDRPLPGLPADINLKLYYYDRLTSDGPEGATLVHKWQPHPKTKFAGFSSDQKFLMFDLYETISDRTTKPPFGLLQVAFDRN
ncbi:MAG TPA: hypothetical protein VM425_13755 [Myxococcota bacterium]|nr:hypothetical protein [Myxococcota bacterium]